MRSSSDVRFNSELILSINPMIDKMSEEFYLSVLSSEPPGVISLLDLVCCLFF